MKIAILDDYQDCVRHLDCFKLLEGHEVKVFTNTTRGVGQLAIRLSGFDTLVLIRERTILTRQLLNKLPNLKLISQTGTLSGQIDIAAAAAQGITIMEGKGDPTAAAELTWALIMAAQRKIPQYAANLKDGLWQIASLSQKYNGLGNVLRGKTLGIWGYGKIGRIVAAYGKAFGMSVLVFGRDTSREQAIAEGYRAASSREFFFSEADLVSLHMRLSDGTRGIVTANDLACMKPSALLINTSRAELIESGALETALKLGRPGFAALDVFETEPLPVNSPLLRMENVLATPHLGYVEKDSYERYFKDAFQNVVDFANGTAKDSCHFNASA